MSKGVSGLEEFVRFRFLRSDRLWKDNREG